MEQLIERNKQSENEPKWLSDRRKASWEAYLSAPLPDRVSHLWKYFDPAWFEFNPKNPKFIEKRNTDNEKATLELKEEVSKDGIIFLPLNKAIYSYSNLIQDRIGQLTSKNPSKIVCLNDAIWSNGYFLYVPCGLKVEKPIVLKNIVGNSTNYETVRVLVILEKDSYISLIDEITSSESKPLQTNVVIEMFLESGSKLNYLNVQINGKETTQHLFQRAQIKENAELNNLIIALGGKISKSDLGVTLDGLNATINTYGIVLGDGMQKFDHHTTIEHNAPQSKSLLNFRVGLKDKARSAYTGNLKIAHHALRSDAYQENRNLLLSGEARADSIPELEILTNDVVRCSHGVTVGQVDKDQIYYLMSRGLDKKEAERIIIEGFLEPTISRIPEESLKEEILLKVKNKLENL